MRERKFQHYEPMSEGGFCSRGVEGGVTNPMPPVNNSYKLCFHGALNRTSSRGRLLRFGFSRGRSGSLEHCWIVIRGVNSHGQLVVLRTFL